MNEKITPIYWTALEYEYKPRSNDWVWTIILISALGAGFAIYFHNYLFGIFILISGGMLLLINLRGPKQLSIQINNEGITMEGTLYKYREIKSFFVHEGESPKLMIETSRHFLPVITIPLNEDIAKTVRATLSSVIEEVHIEESKSMQFAEKMGV